MDKEKKKIVAIIGSGLLLCILIFMFIWSVIFVRYGDHVKYDVDIIVSLQLGVGIICFFIILGFNFFIGMINYADYMTEHEKARIRELEEELERQKKKG